jgi:hypothetical protein
VTPPSPSPSPSPSPEPEPSGPATEPGEPFHSPQALLSQLARDQATFVGSAEPTSVRSSNGRQDSIYPSGARLILFLNDTTKLVLPLAPDATEPGKPLCQITNISFANGDVKRMYSYAPCGSATHPGKHVYLYRDVNTLVTSLPALEFDAGYTEGATVKLYRFPGGQLERHQPDGSKVITYEDGTTKTVNADGSETAIFADGTIVTVAADGSRQVGTRHDALAVTLQ